MFVPVMAGIYVHIPFCKQACYYCDFHFSTNRSYERKMVDALVREIHLQPHYLNGEPVQTIYFGGGTPSLLHADALNRVIEAIRQCHVTTDDAEVTLEANPDDLSIPKLRDLRNLGVNRLSVGIQSFNDAILKSLHRAHDGNSARRCLTEASDAGFHNVSADIIYAIPGQSPQQLQEDLDEILGYRPAHISAYTLTIEEKTVFGQLAARGKMTAVPDDLAAFAMEKLISAVTRQGYAHYEVSNFAQSGFISKHNSNYWKGDAYLGIGPSAHSYNGTSRQCNTANNHDYMGVIQRGAIPATIEILSRENQINEYLMTGLRTMWGVDLKALYTNFGLDVVSFHAEYIDQLLERQLATLDNDILRLTRSGLLVADRISADLFVHLP
jgi:oxygen-independent coproporphyrinogen-3 oxidase